MVEASTQIYLERTLIELYGEVEGQRRWRGTCNEVIAQLGKGSGKDYCSAISIARIVYLLLCLKEPAKYYGKPRGNSIDILNIAINAQQAQNVFFKELQSRITECPWFDGKYKLPITQGEIRFAKNITCYSGHSEREGWEGYNLIAAVLDEIAGFNLDSNTGNENAKTAESIYKMYSGSVGSRFPSVGKTILLSFPRYQGDFIQQRYEEVIAEKETVEKELTLKLHNDMPDGIEENEFTIQWEEDRIVSYLEPKVYALKRPTWVVNPTWSLEEAKVFFWRDPVDALSRYACMPPLAIDAFFKDKEKVETAFRHRPVPVDDRGVFREWFQPDPDQEYYLHVDLAKKHDRAAVAMAHALDWRDVKLGDKFVHTAPVVKVDVVRWWTPRTDQQIDFDDIKAFILSLRARGFRIKLVTFDQWYSLEMIEYLNSIGIRAEKLSVQKPQYEEMLLAVAEGRVDGYHIDILVNELLKLKIMKNDKIDHPRQGSKDLADAVCGAIYNVVQWAVKPEGGVLDVKYLDEMKPKPQLPPGVIKAPPNTRVPNDIQDFLGRLRVIE